MTPKEAQSIYRNAWTQHRMSADPEMRHAMEVTMDAVQPHCTSAQMPGEEWCQFIETLPGYQEHWSNLKDRCNEMALAAYGTAAFLKPS